MSSWDIYFFLLLAVGTGWTLGYFSPRRKSGDRSLVNRLYEDYFIGLNYLLNDEPDEAIDTFIKALEINSDTVETHLALGALLRRRGKVDKAISVHQSLLARQRLSQDFMDSARLQLALDYIAAGLLDRAERLLQELLNEGGKAQWEALTHLITVFQTEREWTQAIACSERLLTHPKWKRDPVVRNRAAHYCCEVTEELLDADDSSRAQEMIKRAFGFNRDHVRARTLRARVDMESGKLRSAVGELQEVCAKNPDLSCIVLDILGKCYEKLDRPEGYEKFLRALHAQTGDIGVAISLAQVVEERAGCDEAESLLRQSMADSQDLRGIAEILRYRTEGGGTADSVGDGTLTLIRQSLERYLAARATFRCDHCGYEARNMNWLCPICQKWDTSKPISANAARGSGAEVAQGE